MRDISVLSCDVLDGLNQGIYFIRTDELDALVGQRKLSNIQYIVQEKRLKSRKQLPCKACIFNLGRGNLALVEIYMTWEIRYFLGADNF